jgi:hypothetical protein
MAARSASKLSAVHVAGSASPSARAAISAGFPEVEQACFFDHAGTPADLGFWVF